MCDLFYCLRDEVGVPSLSVIKLQPSTRMFKLYQLRPNMWDMSQYEASDLTQVLDDSQSSLKTADMTASPWLQVAHDLAKSNQVNISFSSGLDLQVRVGDTFVR